MHKHVPAALVGLLLAVAASACGPGGPLNGRASDEWTHRYPLTPTGQVSITNTNGTVDVEATDGSDVEVRAERTARGVSDAAARDLLPRIAIREDIKPDAVSIETEKMGGIMFGASFDVRYHVRAPKNAAVHVSTTNGRITLTGIGGAVSAETANGAVTGKALGGGPVDVEATNGPINIDMAAIGAGTVKVTATNGPITLTLPDAAKADIQASVSNGSVNVMAAHFEASDQSRRHVEGKLNGGGTPIALTTTNGPIRVATRSQASNLPVPLRGPELRGRP